MICHGDGGHFLFGDDLHQLLDFAGAIERLIVGGGGGERMEYRP